MTSLADSNRITWSCPALWWLCVTVMGLLSPGIVYAVEPDLGLGENSLTPRHWHNNSTPTMLYCRTGHTLQIFRNKTVRGTMHASPEKLKSVQLVFITLEKNTLAIRSLDTGYFLCMHETSEVYASETHSKDCEWTEIILETWYNVYQHKHHMRRKKGNRGKKRYILAFNTDGTTRLGNISRKSQKNAQFIKKSQNSKPTSVVTGSRHPTTKLANGRVSRPFFQPTQSTTSTVAPTTKRPHPPKLGCKRLKTRYCKRMRRLWKQGESIKHAKRHRKCKPRRLSNDKQTLKDRRKLRRLQRRCQRIRRKRLERRKQSKSGGSRGVKQRTSMLTHLTTRLPPHR